MLIVHKFISKLILYGFIREGNGTFHVSSSTSKSRMLQSKNLQTVKTILKHERLKREKKYS